MPLTIPPGQVLINSSDVSINSLANKLTANGLSFSTITAISNGATYESIQPNFNLAFSAGTASINSGTMIMSNSNGVSFGMSYDELTGSVVRALSLNISAGAQLVTAGAISFSNANNVSFGISSNSITASVPAGVNATGNLGAVSAAGGIGSTGTIVFANSNNITFGSIAANFASMSFLPFGPVAVSAGTTLASTGTIIFSNSNNMSFGMNGNTITASALIPVSAGVIDISAGTTKASGTVVFSSSNNVAVGINGQTFTASAATSNVGITAISAAGSSVSSGTVVFSNSNNFSFGLNNNTLTAAIPTISYFEYPKAILASVSGGFVSSGSMQFFPINIFNNLTATQAKLMFTISVQTTNASTVRGTFTVALGLYTNNAGTLSLASNGSQSYSWTVSSTVTSIYNGVKEMTVPFNVNASPGNYWVGYWVQASNVNGGIGLTHVGGINPVGGQAISGLFGIPPTTTQRLLDGLGFYSVSSSTLMTSADLNSINHMSNPRIPWIAFRNI